MGNPYNQLVRVGSVLVLELRDPNSGQDPDPASKPRHQYLRTPDGTVWRRVLPPKTVGDEWRDRDTKWEPVAEPPAPGFVRGLAPLPHNLDAEASVLGGILLNPKDALTWVLVAEDFYAPAHREIFSAILRLKDEGRPIDIITLEEDLRSHDKLGRVGGVSALAELMSRVPTVENIGHHARIVRDKATLRSLIQTDLPTANAAVLHRDHDDIVFGPITDAWWNVPLPPCPDCGGGLVWWEAGYVPGARKCVGQPIGLTPKGQPKYDSNGGCGSMFMVNILQRQQCTKVDQGCSCGDPVHDAEIYGPDAGEDE